MTKLLEALEKNGWDKAIANSYNIDNKQFLKLRNSYYKSRERLLNYIIKHGEVHADKQEGPRSH